MNETQRALAALVETPEAQRSGGLWRSLAAALNRQAKEWTVSLRPTLARELRVLAQDAATAAESPTNGRWTAFVLGRGSMLVARAAEQSGMALGAAVGAAVGVAAGLLLRRGRTTNSIRPP